MAFTAKLKILDDKRLRALIADAGNQGQAWAEETAENILDEADRLMQGSKTGVQYPNLPNRSSAPGEAPAVQSGELIRSGKAEGRGASVRVVYDDPKAPMLELGNSRVAPRPFLRPAFDAEKPRAIKRAKEIVEG